jgi:hypothetical protein
MPLFGSIEKKTGVEEPGYEPPIDDAPVEAPDETSFGWLEVIGSLLIPIAGVVFAIMRFVREEVGKGLACLLLALIGFYVWTLVLGVT